MGLWLNLSVDILNVFAGWGEKLNNECTKMTRARVLTVKNVNVPTNFFLFVRLINWPITKISREIRKIQ